jgi:hypothetical protein
MPAPIAYDITRLVTRVLNATPNGIDRVDHALASHFVDPAAEHRFGMIATAVLSQRLFSAKAARAAIDGIAAHWGEGLDPTQDAAYAKVAALLAGALPPEPPGLRGAENAPAVPPISFVDRNLFRMAGNPARRPPGVLHPRPLAARNAGVFS